jgi:hypothetical protein
MHDSILAYYWTDEQMWSDLFPALSTSSSTTDILNAQTTIISNSSPALACFFAADIAYQPYRMQQVVISSNDPKYATLFAATIPNADIKTLQSIVLKSGDLTSLVRFAFYVPKADKSAIQKAVVKSDNAKAAYEFLKHVPNASASALKTIIIQSRKPTYLLELARKTKSKKLVKQIEDILVKDKAIKACRILMQQVSGANVRRLERAIMNSGNVAEIKALAKDKQTKAAGLAVLF